MKIHTFFQDIEKSKGQVDPSEAHHMTRVLRLTQGDTIRFIDGKGSQWITTLRTIRPSVTVDIMTKQIYQPSKPFVRIIISAIKFSLLDDALRHLTEMGVDEIILTKTDYSQIGLPILAAKQSRINTIIQNACKQSERPIFPQISILSYDSIPLSDQNLIATTQYTRTPTSLLTVTPAESYNLFIGPEAGFSQTEYQSFAHKGYTPVSFGPYIMRTETAAIVGAGILCSQKNDSTSETPHI